MKEKTLQKIEQLALGIIWGAIPVFSLFIAGWWLSIPFVPESQIYIWALSGLLLGIVVDVIFLRRWVRKSYSTRLWIWAAIYVYYAVGMFGFFMGFPLFHVLLAIPAGLYIGRVLIRSGADRERMQKVARKLAIFTTAVLFVICLASAILALINGNAARELQGMFDLSFTVTNTVVVGIILSGGTAMLVFGWWLTIATVKWMYSFSVQK